ncbi:ExbD/TolR family protein [Rubellicoccus peritrichatus]|uniref:Biopolymer transporter ExbD n=1 Tax=Rubellicoccus peritrichatus TaxID=3080537 RepID=A0AAQ3LBU7_9BACT|nr:biopolymer transporter ExbD [Puniceicoccus sp. CR14]WOO42536.1 biopolymer transporter ExbD [Puniceicoccus sp. CR14]
MEQTVSSGLRPLGLQQALSVPERRIDFVPLFDVLLLGFMFFMLGSRFVFAPGISIELPQSAQQTLGGIPTLDVLTVKNDNFLIFQGTKYSLDGLELFLASDLWEQPPADSYLLLKADQSVDLQTFVSISQMAKTAGYAGVQLAVKDPGEESRSGLDETSSNLLFP